MGVLNAVTEHLHLQKRVFVVPDFDPPLMDPSDPFPVWYRQHPSHEIRFEDRSFDNEHIDVWQDYVFACRFKVLQQVQEEMIRSPLLTTALANHSTSSLQRVHFLLAANRDVFAR